MYYPTVGRGEELWVSDGPEGTRIVRTLSVGVSPRRGGVRAEKQPDG